MRKKSKTFTGCWTCRARRVKCDEAQPVCNRCTKARRICEGYGVRLTWKSNEKETPFRVLIDLDTDGVEIPPVDLNDMINKCCYTEASYETQTFGPFSVFSIGQNIGCESLEQDRNDPGECQENQGLVEETATENAHTPYSNESLIGTSQHSLPESSNEAPSHVTIFGTKLLGRIMIILMKMMIWYWMSFSQQNGSLARALVTSSHKRHGQNSESFRSMSKTMRLLL
ncbi:hypothetical protein FOXG_20239 [Fusarium oxysporum f. sp. lycopersici 4287]|uniref:Zn(2)-C6 fungal-type domain-containing protein n=2 Tax=Fusarium oxysporum TaxID=5507 RepID=A0A0J9WPT9_FUSO4|nr:hypothetical protein FOXG_20239 [Fusarium oxysporum f. sp. lycopersici 4287]EXK27628.1 hypothetical protein FOMG_15862 [Fusarium oxysporum f. sp. melonis 26406]KNB09612.1 hypothetical protein FOXG_20239 [Fusarium oxysporum f. sp. lycopersici 4287]